MEHIVNIKTNIKSLDGESRTWNIGKNTLLIGKNESGKSTIAEAIQLALSGSVAGLLLRPGEVKKGEDLASLISPGNDSAEAQVKFSNGDSSRWSMTRGKRPKQEFDLSINAEVGLPITALKAKLSGSSDKAIRFFFEAFGQKMTLKELTKLAPPSAGEFPPEILETFTTEETPRDFKHSPQSLLDILEKIASKKRNSRAKAKALEQTLTHFSGAQSVDKSEIYTAWKELFRSLHFEQLRKIYRNNEGLRSFCAQELEGLGSPQELKALNNSVEASEEVQALLEQKLMAEMAGRVRIDAREAVRWGAMFQAAEAIINGAIRETTKDLLPAYCARASRFLPEGESLFCSIESGKFYYGILRQEDRGVSWPCGVIHRAMSGSTEVRVLAAMAAALVLPTEGLSVLVLDDRMWDMDTLRETMCALEDAPCQVIIMSTFRPKGKPRKKWSYVNVAEDHYVDDAT